MAIQAQMYAENLRFAYGAGPQDLLLSNDDVCGFDFIPQQQQQQQQFDQLQNFSHQKNQSFLIENNNIQQQQSMAFPQSIVSAHFEKQRMEIDQFINLQNERLRQAIQQQRKHQTSQLLKKYESKARFLLNQKDEEIAKASNRTNELQILLKRIELENQTWQRVAKENEAMVGSLNATIQRLRETASEDAESFCQNIEQEEKTKNVEQITRNKMVCKCCGTKNACVVMLPCRHLCSCRNCEVFLDSCPVCRMVKKASIEALL